MSSVLEGGEQLERELTQEAVFRPAAGSLLLHGALAGAIVLYGVLGGFFHRSDWGGAGGGAIQVSLVSNALPLPSNQMNQNVLATDTPSQAPAEQAPKARQAVEDTSIAIQGKPKKPQPVTQQKNQKPPAPENRAQYGEHSGSSMARATMAQTGPPGPTAVSDGDFGSRFGWYVGQINSKMAANWYKPEVDPRTPKGARVFLIFTLHRDGSPKDVQIDRSSGSPTLDRSCVRGVQRVDTFGSLPPQYLQSALKVSYYCEY